MVTILEDADGRVDLAQLEEELERYAGRPLKIGTFSAASNVTGIVTDVERVATLLHRHGALSCWDYGAAGPHLPIEMNPDAELAYKDAVFISPHKFVGGPGTPGVLVAKRSLFRNRVPAVPGGGTISFVSPAGHSYHPDPEVREEGGTPAIVESIRAGLAFALKDAVGANEIRRREERIVRRALSSWGANPRIEVFGNQSVDRIGIVSLGLRHPRGLLHSHFVGAVLNDLFGIQVRSGCFCAGPYLHRLLPIGEGWSRRMHAEVANGHDGREALAPARQLRLLHERRCRRLRGRSREPDRRGGLEAAAATTGSIPTRPAGITGASGRTRHRASRPLRSGGACARRGARRRRAFSPTISGRPAASCAASSSRPRRRSAW